MGTNVIVNVRDIDLSRWQPFQGLGNIAGPDAPCGTVSEFHQMAPIVFLDLHRRSSRVIDPSLGGPKSAEIPAIGATAQATIGGKDGCADEFFRERRDRSAPPPGTKRIPQPRGPGR